MKGTDVCYENEISKAIADYERMRADFNEKYTKLLDSYKVIEKKVRQQISELDFFRK